MEAQQLINMLFGVLGVILGFLLKTLWSIVKDLQDGDKELVNRISQLETLVAGNYVERNEFTKTMSRVFDKLDKIDDKLSTKADKPGG